MEEGTEVFKTTLLLLSPSKRAGPSTGTPSMRRMKCISMIMSVAILAATNSAPYVDVSTVLCFFEYHRTGVFLINKRIAVTDLHVTTS